MWGDLHNVQDDAHRGAYYAEVRLKLTPGRRHRGADSANGGRSAYEPEAESEAGLLQDEARSRHQIARPVMIVSVIMVYGAIFGAMNTMYAVVLSRTTEIGTLRALGFAPLAVMTSFLARVSGACGRGGRSRNPARDAYQRAIDDVRQFCYVLDAGIQLPRDLRNRRRGNDFAAVMGMVGGGYPARQAMKMPVVDALRSV